ncbi:AMP-binding protein [Mycobacterium sp. Y57]|uniref:AMP-binding protein n=1 Tax=Mycolicibacterium xanthum TaxID=2796469 RepID=UPI001C855139|nr:AMP-binding protein [Mycolicibacterium xanthum]MBX7431918.1 AMP-binding protein [Mycolicibacterium xanthum]
MAYSAVTDVLRERASLQPDDVAFTFVDYDIDPGGVAVTLTWSQLSRRVVNFAHELRSRGSIGDRAVILLPQSLDYIVAFLGSLHAGLIAAPLSVPFPGVHDERVSAVLRDASPTVIVATSAMAEHLSEYTAPLDDQAKPTVVEIDALDLDGQTPRALKRAKMATAYLQYTSGSTRTPAGVMVTHRNLTANFEQIMAGFFPGKVAPADTTAVSWLPFYHDMGLMLGVCAPILGGWHTVFTTPASFLARPARWIQLLASYPSTVTAAPNFAFELAVGRTSDDDLAGKDLSGVRCVLSGSERVHHTTLKRFVDRFTRFDLAEEALRPSYGLAEATLFVATREPGLPPHIVHFAGEKLSAGHAKRCDNESGTPLVGYGAPESPLVYIVDPATKTECPAGTLGEIWVMGENVCVGYWENPEQSEHTFNAYIDGASPETPPGPWLRTGDLGFISEGELFIVGRIKDVVIVRGRNHYPDDIEATIQEITGGRVAAISVENEHTEELVVIAEVKAPANPDADAIEHMRSKERDVTSALSRSHGLSAADLVLVPRGSIPITTSGKVRRSACSELYRNDALTRLVPR